MLAAVGAAICFAASSALQHRSTADTDGLPSLRTRQLWVYAVRSLRHPIWMAGLAADAAGLTLHALALHDGPLTLVQPLMVIGIVFALPMRQWLDHRRPRTSELLWSLVLSAGLVVFLAIASPANSTTSAPDRVPVLVVGTVLASGVLTATVTGRRTRGTSAALSFGIAAGLSFAASAALIKTVTDVASRHPASLITSWAVYALVVVGGCAVLLNQLAFQAGPLQTSLPAISTVDPITSLVIGITVFDEHFRWGALAATAELGGLLSVVLATVALARCELPETRQHGPGYQCAQAK